MNEEQKAINILKNMTTNYSLTGEELHYANILYYLIINLQQENNELHNKIDKAMNLVNNEIYKNRCNCSRCNSYYLKEMKKILKDSDVDE